MKPERGWRCDLADIAPGAKAEAEATQATSAAILSIVRWGRGAVRSALECLIATGLTLRFERDESGIIVQTQKDRP